MELMLKIVKKLIVVFEGCVLKLKELEARYTNGENEHEIAIERDVITHENNNTSSPNNQQEEGFNISLFDQYVKEIGLPLGANFVSIIQRVEVVTELNIIESLLKKYDDTNCVISIFESLSNDRTIEFVWISPSSLRPEESNIVNRQIILDELSEIGVAYDESHTLFENSLRVLQAKQKKVIFDFVNRFNNGFVSIKTLADDDAIIRRKDILKNELLNRKQILEIKMQR